MGLFDCFSSSSTNDTDTKHSPGISGPSASSRQVEPAGSSVHSNARDQATEAGPLGARPPRRAKQHQDRDPLADQPGCRYRKVRDLNDGTSGFVQLAEDIHNQQMVAIKFLPRGKKLIKDADREICNLRLCCMHPYIIRFHEAFLTEKHLAIASEYASMGDLADYIESRRVKSRHPRGVPEAHARHLFQQLMLAVDFCHQKGIVNRDLKLENVLLTDGNESSAVGLPTVKLCDFGFSKDEAVDSICKTACGTPEYVAPEVLVTNQYSGRAADIWSAGVVLYVMLTGQFPFRQAGDENIPQQNKLKAIFPRIVRAQYQPPTWISQSSCELLQGMLQPDLQLRMNVEDVLAHPWFQEGLPSGMKDINANLLKVSDILLTSFASQTEQDILRVVTEAMQLPTAPFAASKLLPSKDRSSRLPTLQERGSQTPPTSAPDGARVPQDHHDADLPRRWRMDQASYQDHTPPSQRYHNFSIASSSDSADRHPSAVTLNPSSVSPGSSYDDLFADGQLLSSVKAPASRGAGRVPGQGGLREAGWSVSEDHTVQRRATSLSGFGGNPSQYGNNPWGAWGVPGNQQRSLTGFGGADKYDRIEFSAKYPSGPISYGHGPEERTSDNQSGAKPFKGSVWAAQHRPQRNNLPPRSSWDPPGYPSPRLSNASPQSYSPQSRSSHSQSPSHVTTPPRLTPRALPTRADPQGPRPESSSASQPALGLTWGNRRVENTHPPPLPVLAHTPQRNKSGPLPPKYDNEVISLQRNHSRGPATPTYDRNTPSAQPQRRQNSPLTPGHNEDDAVSSSSSGARRRHQASPDWVSKEVARNQWSPHHAASAGSERVNGGRPQGTHPENGSREMHVNGSVTPVKPPPGQRKRTDRQLSLETNSSSASSVPDLSTPSQTATSVGTTRF